MTSEGEVKKELKKYLNKIGAWNYWPVSNGMGRHGIPDCIGCYKGHFFAIECKAPGRREEDNGGASALQMAESVKINDAGGNWRIFDGRADDWEMLYSWVERRTE